MLPLVLLFYAFGVPRSSKYSMIFWSNVRGVGLWVACKSLPSVVGANGRER